MIARLASGLLRAVLVFLVIMTPALMLPEHAAENAHIVLLIALFAAVLTLVEYSAHFPSIIEFRDAPPLNRLRFLALFFSVLLVSVIVRGTIEPTLTTRAITSLGLILGNLIDVPLSPIRLIGLMLPVDASASQVASVRAAAGLSFLVSLTALGVFLLLVKVPGWPMRGRNFNIWVNLPLFHPTTGGDILQRLHRDARLNIALGLLLPFLIPAVVKAAGLLIDPISLSNSQTLIWTMTAWAFLPASCIMRGLALRRIADIIAQQRKRATDGRPTPGLQPAV